jgi:acyl-CoA thioester hydrolase
MIQRTAEIRVRYADTDQLKNVYYGKYFEYFEQGRSDFMRSLGLPYGELERQGFHLPVIEAFARYRRSARYDDLFLVETRLPGIPGAKVRFEYSIVRDGETDVLVEGYTVHGFVNASSGRPTRAPEMLLNTIAKAIEGAKT